MLAWFLLISDLYYKLITFDLRGILELNNILNLKTAELYMPQLHSRPSKSGKKIIIMQHLQAILHASGILYV